MLADGGNAIDAALAANFVLGVVTPYMCGFGGDLLAMVWDGELHAYRGVGRAPAGATADVRAPRSRARTRCPCSGRTRSPCRARSRLVHAHREVRRRVRSASSRQRALHYAERGFPAHQAGRVVLHGTVRCSTSTSGCPISTTYYGDVAAGRLGPPTRARAHDPHARRRRSRRVLPRARSARRSRSASSGPAGCMTVGRRRRARRRVGRTAARAVPRRRDPRDAAADAGRDRARSAADRRRPRPRRRRPRPRAPVDRGDQARAGRPAPRISAIPTR